MPQPGLIEQILLGVLVLVVLVLFWPGIKSVMERSRQAEERDWTAALVPIAIVALFVMLLIALV